MVRYSQRLTGSCSSVDGSMLKMLTRQGHHYFLKPKIKKQRNWDFSFISLNKESLQKNFANLQLICSERNKTFILPRTRTKIIDLFSHSFASTLSGSTERNFTMRKNMRRKLEVLQEAQLPKFELPSSRFKISRQKLPIQNFAPKFRGSTFETVPQSTSSKLFFEKSFRTFFCKNTFFFILWGDP